MKEKLYIKAEDCPNFDMEELREMKISLIDFKGVKYIEINPCSYCEEWEGMFLIDIEITDMKENRESGEFNGWGNTANKDFYPCGTDLFFKESALI